MHDMGKISDGENKRARPKLRQRRLSKKQSLQTVCMLLLTGRQMLATETIVIPEDLSAVRAKRCAVEEIPAHQLMIIAILFRIPLSAVTALLKHDSLAVYIHLESLNRLAVYNSHFERNLGWKRNVPIAIVRVIAW